MINVDKCYSFEILLRITQQGLKKETVLHSLLSSCDIKSFWSQDPETGLLNNCINVLQLTSVS